MEWWGRCSWVFHTKLIIFHLCRACLSSDYGDLPFYPAWFMLLILFGLFSMQFFTNAQLNFNFAPQCTYLYNRVSVSEKPSDVNLNSEGQISDIYNGFFSQWWHSNLLPRSPSWFFPILLLRITFFDCLGSRNLSRLPIQNRDWEAKHFSIGETGQ